MSGMVINLKFTKALFDDSKIHPFLSIIDTFIKRGGIEMRLNVVDRQILEDVKAHPEKHGNLIVRIGGYSDCFVNQTSVMQDNVIAVHSSDLFNQNEARLSDWKLVTVPGSFFTHIL